MTGSPSDSYMGGLFRTRSASNIARSGQGYAFGGEKAKIIKRNLARLRLDNFAELLANGATIKSAAERAGVSEQKGKSLFKQICDGLGPQAQ